MRNLALAAFAALALVPFFGMDFSAQADELPHTGVTWMTNYEDAKALAKKDDKNLVLNFTGSDWCIWCKRLEGEVFSKPEFADAVADDYVFVFLDFPRDPALKEKVVDEALNNRLKDEIGVRGFPTIALTTADGMPYARTGYQKGGPANYLTHLEELEKAAAPIHALTESEASLKDPKKIEAAWPAIVKSGFLGHSAYAPVLEQAKKIDADGSKGMKAKIESFELEKELDMLVQEMQASGGPPDWAKLTAFIEGHPKLTGGMFVNIAFGCAKNLAAAGENKRAIALYDRILEDDVAKGDPKVKAIVETARKEALEEPKE